MLLQLLQLWCVLPRIAFLLIYCFLRTDLYPHALIILVFRAQLFGTLILNLNLFTRNTFWVLAKAQLVCSFVFFPMYKTFYGSRNEKFIGKFTFSIVLESRLLQKPYICLKPYSPFWHMSQIQQRFIQLMYILFKSDSFFQL